MNENPFKNEYKLQQHLDSDHIEIPDFPKTVSRFDRLIGFLASPAKDPVEATIGNDLSMVFHVSLLVGIPILSLITIFLATL
ncbi:hypothetical protein CN425_21345 [Bacillus cereus]|uniref:Uncharacterized protein n=1 Tax=Bacillus cereus TaxID=1396 RepID=A0A2A9U422_BACCE|nr:hypothetical protein [Bacillus cereus]EJS73363.1 hypothetical protein ICU_00758 [Bacillus cereus BAG2X1-1]EJS78073.1 hypothetical protein ICY_00611 [Bacillus cereus BAG2X1-3]PEA10449.1 hypothetical protein CON38_05385 [Bacillus cereus]PEV97909.1 hypothetical protein CN425_21345 [Bacillus cereus]PFI18829.1 hypothetical protein COI75_17960 [Bacillus cereus]